MASGPQNVLTGDDFGTDLPQAQPDVDTLAEEKNMAKFSKSKEFGKLKEYLEIRIEFYQHFLPDGREVGLQGQATPEDWAVANRVIGELRAVINQYESAKEVVDARPKDE